MKQINLSYAFLPVLFFSQTLPMISQEVIETRAKNQEVIASHVMGIVGNVVSLVKEPKDEDEIGANIVALFTNILGCIFAATKRGNIPFDISQEEIDMLLASLDQELIDAIQKAVLTRAHQIRSL